PTAYDPHAVLAELNSRLDRLVEDAGPDSWTLDTPAGGWDVGMQIAHLAWSDEVALAAVEDLDAFAAVGGRAVAEPPGVLEPGAGAAELPSARRSEDLPRGRSAREQRGRALAEVDPGEKIPWFGPPMRARSMATARVMETWAHGTDVADALGIRVDSDPAFVAALPHVARIGYRTRGFAYSMNGLEPPSSEVRVELTGPDGAVHEFGPEDADERVTGPLLDFCLL